MTIGLGIVLIIAGLVLVTDAITVDMSFIDDQTLGVILLLAGVLAIVLSLLVNHQRTRATYVEERRGVEPPVR